MSPRKPAVLRGGDGQDLREHLIVTAARLIEQRGSARLSVRDIAREAQVADGVLYNYFEDKEDLLAHALLAHVGGVMGGARPMPVAGTGMVAGNLRIFIEGALAVLTQVMPAFAGLIHQPKVLSRFREMVGGAAAFSPAAAEAEGGRPAHHEGPAGLPTILDSYLREEQRLGRIDSAADVGAVATLIIGAIHGEILPRVLFHPPGAPIVIPPWYAERLSNTIMLGIAPRDAR